jgi:hypothetical protein
VPRTAVRALLGSASSRATVAHQRTFLQQLDDETRRLWWLWRATPLEPLVGVRASSSLLDAAGTASAGVAKEIDADDSSGASTRSSASLLSASLRVS